MRRLTSLNVAAVLVVAALAAALVAAATGGANSPELAAAKTPPAGTFRQALAAKLGEQLHKPAADVLAALKDARRAVPAGPRGLRRAARLTARAQRLSARAGAQRAKRPARAKRLTARAHRLAARARALSARAGTVAGATRAQRAHARRDAWAAAVAKPLGVDAADVTAALRALVAQRLDSLVRDGWLTSERRDAELACFDAADRCSGVGRPPGLRTLRAGL